MVKVLPDSFVCQHYDRSSHKIGLRRVTRFDQIIGLRRVATRFDQIIGLRRVATRFDQIIGLIKGILGAPGDLNYGLGGALKERPLNPLPTPR